MIGKERDKTSRLPKSLRPILVALAVVSHRLPDRTREIAVRFQLRMGDFPWVESLRPTALNAAAGRPRDTRSGWTPTTVDEHTPATEVLSTHSLRGTRPTVMNALCAGDGSKRVRGTAVDQRCGLFRCHEGAR